MSKIYKVFAYGSLINRISLARTVPKASNIVPAKAFGLKRMFNLASTYRYDQRQQAPVCVLNAEAAAHDTVLNGTCFDIDAGELPALLERERGYLFKPLEVCHYHDESVRFSAYYFSAQDFPPYRFLASSPEQTHYLQVCLDGSTVYGPEFTEAFKRTTGFWDIDSNRDLQAIWRGEF